MSQEEVTHYCTIDSPVGPLFAVERAGNLRRLAFAAEQGWEPEGSWEHDEAPFAELRRQLEEYFAGGRREFDVPIAPEGTEFQMAVWAALVEIPYGATATYGQIAQAIGRPTAVRAVGGANNANRIAIVIPCHRVIGADGSLTGFGGGLEAKSTLLDLEGSLHAR